MDYKYLREIGTKPRVHPNGFVQLDLTENTKLHIWPEQPIKTVDVQTPHHDHTFSFSSQVILGALQHTVYRPTESESGKFHLYTVYPFKAQNQETPFVRLDDKRYDMEVVREFIISAGQKYFFEAFEFHSSQSISLTATIIKVSPFDKSLQARVTCRYDQEPQLFRRDSFDEEFLWSIVRTVFPE